MTVFWLALAAIVLVVLGGYMKLCTDAETQAELIQAARNSAYGTAMQVAAAVILTLIVVLAGGSYGPGNSSHMAAAANQEIP